jgi:poly-beta-1,6-N-acetyl-D-glucosamine synthase
MGRLEVLYWVGVGVVVYTYAVYPALLAVLARLWARPVRLAPAPTKARRLPGVSVVLAVYNEEVAIGRRLREFTTRIAESGLDGEIVVVSDGSTDDTAEVARGFEGDAVRVTVIALDENVGKAAALSTGCLAAQNEIIALTDARQTWAADALARLLENFADPAVGAVSGELVVESAPGVMAGVGLYWRVEKWLRRRESAVHSTVGVTGSICAVRRELFRPIPPGTILDDVYWPLLVAMQGFRVVFDARARAFDRLPERVGAEFCRKVRTLSGNYQLAARLPSALVPWRNPVWFAFVSHKLLRLAVPWALLATLVLASALGGPLYGSLFAAEVGLIAVGLAGLVPGVGMRSRLASAGASFLMLNAAAWLAFWVWASGRAARSWTKTTYQPRPAFEVEIVEGAVR